MSRLLDLPLFDDRHRALASRLRTFAAAAIEPGAAEADSGDTDEAGRRAVRAFAAEGLFRLLIEPGRNTTPRPDLRSVCLAREAFAASSALADSVFAVQGLGSLPLVLAGSDELRSRYLPALERGDAIGAFALTEPSAGSDVSSIETTATRSGDEIVLDGTKTLVSNAGIATHYVVFAKTAGQSSSDRPGITAVVVDAGTPGLTLTRRIPLIAPHPIGEIRFDGCRVPSAHLLGDEGQGLRVALATLDFFRPSVGAAACGLATRALDESRRFAGSRRQFGSALIDFQATRFALADMATELDAARLLVYRAAWAADSGQPRFTREASMAKLYATEAAQRIVDRGVQLHGGLGVQRGVVVERLYREVRALRIYEGTSEIQRLIIADRMLRD